MLCVCRQPSAGGDVRILTPGLEKIIAKKLDKAY
jgi:hypothetical protein